MKFVYFGTADFAVPAMERLKDSICLVVSQPDRPARRGMQLTPSPVAKRAEELGLPVEKPEKCRAPEFVERVRSLEADALIVAAYGQILPVALLESAKNGAINLHGSILPAYRGAAPIQRAIQNGDDETGVTLMQMDRGMDTGDMIAIARTPIGPDETYGELAERLSAIAADLVEDWAQRIAEGDYPRTPQDSSLATHAAKVEKAEAELSFLRAVEGEYNRFRAFTPSPGAFIQSNQGMARLSRVNKDDRTAKPGTVVAVAPELVVAFDGGSLALLELQPEGKKRMAGRDWANGCRLRPGDTLVN